VSILCLASALISARLMARSWPSPQERKDYLTETEADKIRDANDPAGRIKLYVSFADDRLKKFQYELTRTTAERRRSEILNGLMNAYSGCVDDAADQIADAKEKQVDIHASLKLLESKSKEFLEALQKIEQGSGPDVDSYKDTLQDAIEATKDAISDAHNAQKEMLPAPVRRKPS
jgi:cellobiose-specific phosphotransferase system component IIA